MHQQLSYLVFGQLKKPSSYSSGNLDGLIPTCLQVSILDFLANHEGV